MDDDFDPEQMDPNLRQELEEEIEFLNNDINEEEVPQTQRWMRNQIAPPIMQRPPVRPPLSPLSLQRVIGRKSSLVGPPSPARQVLNNQQQLAQTQPVQQQQIRPQQQVVPPPVQPTQVRPVQQQVAQPVHPIQHFQQQVPPVGPQVFPAQVPAPHVQQQAVHPAVAPHQQQPFQHVPMQFQHQFAQPHFAQPQIPLGYPYRYMPPYGMFHDSIKPPVFTGRESPRIWRMKFQQYVAGWPEDMALQLIGSCMQGSRKDWYDSIFMDIQYATLQEVLEQFELDHTNKEQRTSETKLMFMDKQSDKEDPRSWWFRLKANASRSANNIAPDLLKQLFHLSLHDSLKDKVRVKDNQTPDELVQSAQQKWIDLGLGTKKKPLIVAAVESRPPPANPAAPPPHPQQPPQPATPPRPTKVFPPYPNERSRIFTLPDGRQITLRFTADGQYICGKCNQIGHKASFHRTAAPQNTLNTQSTTAPASTPTPQAPAPAPAPHRINAVDSQEMEDFGSLAPVAAVEEGSKILHTSSLVKILMKINQLPFTAVVDSGACCSVASEHVIRKMQLSSHIKPYTGPQLRAADDEPIAMTGQVTADIQIGERSFPMTISIAKHFPLGMVLGLDFMICYSPIMDFKLMKFIVEGEQVPLIYPKNPQSSMMALTQNVVIPPRSFVRIPLWLKNQISSMVTMYYCWNQYLLSIVTMFLEELSWMQIIQSAWTYVIPQIDLSLSSVTQWLQSVHLWKTQQPYWERVYTSQITTKKNSNHRYTLIIRTGLKSNKNRSSICYGRTETSLL